MSTSSYLSENGSLDSLEYFRLSTWRQREHCVSACSSCGSSCDSPQLNECCSLTLRRRWSCLEARDVIMIVMIVFWTATLCQDHCIHHLICYLFWRRGTWSSVARDGIGQGQPSACVCVCVCVCVCISFSQCFLQLRNQTLSGSLNWRNTPRTECRSHPCYGRIQLEVWVPGTGKTLLRSPIVLLWRASVCSEGETA